MPLIWGDSVDTVGSGEPAQLLCLQPDATKWELRRREMHFRDREKSIYLDEDSTNSVRKQKENLI